MQHLPRTVRFAPQQQHALAFALCVGALALTACQPTHAQDRAKVAPDARAATAQPQTPEATSDASGPVVLELFTSQGCSSCPPADRVLESLGRDPKLRGEVITLAFHVDYWNDLGWRDPFSSEAWSTRQRLYARAMGSSRLYTPQMVVHGRTHAVGSSDSTVRAQMRDARKTPRAGAITLQARAKGRHVTVTSTAKLTRAVSDDAVTLGLALVQKRDKTRVPRGENAGKTLTNTYIVRAWHEGQRTDAAPGTEAKLAYTFTLPEGVNADDVRVVALLQGARSMHVHAAAAADVTP